MDEGGVVRIPANIGSVLFNAALQLAVIFFLFVSSWASPPYLILAIPCLLVFLFSLSNWVATWTVPALLGDAEGITDATGTAHGGLVHWHEISGFAEATVSGQPALLIHLHDPLAYLDRLPKAKRALLAGSVPVHGTPCIVGQNDIGIPVAEALSLLEAARARFAAVPVPVPAFVNGASVLPATRWWTAIPPEERNVQPLRNNADR